MDDHSGCSRTDALLALARLHGVSIVLRSALSSLIRQGCPLRSLCYKAVERVYKYV